MKDILKFAKQVKETAENEEYNKSIKTRNAYQEKEIYKFHLCSTKITPYAISTYIEKLIDLDDADMDYFKKKYFPELVVEMEDKINRLKDEYNETIIK